MTTLELPEYKVSPLEKNPDAAKLVPVDTLVIRRLENIAGGDPLEVEFTIEGIAHALKVDDKSVKRTFSKLKEHHLLINVMRKTGYIETSRYYLSVEGEPVRRHDMRTDNRFAIAANPLDGAEVREINRRGFFTVFGYQIQFPEIWANKGKVVQCKFIDSEGIEVFNTHGERMGLLPYSRLDDAEGNLPLQLWTGERLNDMLLADKDEMDAFFSNLAAALAEAQRERVTGAQRAVLSQLP